MWGYDYGSWWGWLVMGAAMLAIWGLVLWGGLALLRGRPGPSASRETPKDKLRQRFAAGEIDEPELRRRMGALTSRGGDGSEDRR